MGNLTEVALYDANDEQEIGRIGLNGYKSMTSSPIADRKQSRLIWGFAVLDGDRGKILQAWSHGKRVVIRTPNHKLSARILAYPSNKTGHGLIEFVEAERVQQSEPGET